MILYMLAHVDWQIVDQARSHTVVGLCEASNIIEASTEQRKERTITMFLHKNSVQYQENTGIMCNRLCNSESTMAKDQKTCLLNPFQQALVSSEQRRRKHPARIRK